LAPYFITGVWLMKITVFALMLGASALPAGAQGQFSFPQFSLAAGTVDVPAVSAPARAAEGVPHDGLNYSGAEEILALEFGLGGLTLGVPETEVAAQMSGSGNRLVFDKAFRLMVESFLEDYQEPTSPLAGIIKTMGYAADSPPRYALKAARERLLKQMNMPGSKLQLLRRDEKNAPARGETVTENWILVLHLNYSERLYWAVGDRFGRVPVYNYGN